MFLDGKILRPYLSNKPNGLEEFVNWYTTESNTELLIVKTIEDSIPRDLFLQFKSTCGIFFKDNMGILEPHPSKNRNH